MAASTPTVAFLTADRGVSSPDLLPRALPHGEMDLVFIEGFRGQTIIGIHGDELNARQLVRIDVCAGTPRLSACQTDRIADTIDYSRVREALVDLLEHHRHRLLEALAEAVAQILIGRFGAHWVRVVVVKPAKFADVDAVGVAIERTRATPASRDASEHARLGAGMVPDTSRS